MARAEHRLTGLLIALWILTAAAAAGAAPPAIKIRGNQVIIDEVYRAVLDLPASAGADRKTARLVQRQILRFLRRAGYVLARVEARVEDDAILVDLDEGRVEKVLFLGSGTLKTLRLKLDLDIPRHVFNRPHLVRQLKYLGRKHGVSKVTYRLVPCRPVEHGGPQIADLGDIQGQAIIPQRADYELHIRLSDSDWSTGLGIDLEYDFPDGLVAGVHYKDEGFLFSEDRWRVGMEAGTKLREELDSGDTYLSLSRAMVEARWYTPPLIGKGLRPFLGAESVLTSRQRGDLGVEIYYRERLDGSLNLGYEIVPGLMVSAGGGVRWRILFGIDQLDDAPAPVEDEEHLRPFLVGKVDLEFDPGGARRDRHHQLQLEGRHYWMMERPSFGKACLHYQKVFGFGWHDLWLMTRGTWLWGEVHFDDEEPVGGRYVRGIFGGSYTRKVAALKLEFRLSLARDLFKVSLYHDLAVFGEIERTDGGERPQLANSFGPGFHALILDTFQFDIYVAFGFDADGVFDYGLSANLKKVF